MKELVIISGKGGTGKTSITASFAALAELTTLADCDVDAADLHLVLNPTIQTSETFTSGCVAEIRKADCTQCGLCEEVCRFDAVFKVEGRIGTSARFAPPRPNADEPPPERNRALHSKTPNQKTIAFEVDPISCEGCGACVEFCPVKAIDFPEQDCGVWNISATRHGPMVHAHMNPGAENSGKLVSLVRQEARKIAVKQKSEFLLVDGPPGIGCPVIASITGADAVLVVSEPTLSGEHDLQRVLELANHFKIPAMVCVNKWDINPVMTERIEQLAEEMGAQPIGRVPYDAAVTAAQINARSLVEESDGGAAQAVRAMWSELCTKM